LVTGRFRANPTPIIERFFGGKECFFVQVGANDGRHRDPLNDLIRSNPQWRGILIEPLHEAFERLVANYRGERERLIFEPIAISSSDEPRALYYVSSEAIRKAGLSITLQGVSSLKRDHVLMHLAGQKAYFELKDEPEAYLSSTTVRCETLQSVLDRHRVSQLDLLVCDAETHDHEILRQVDFRKFRPKLILYEHVSLGKDGEAIRSLLSSNGYRLARCGDLDTIAVRYAR
jgi:FkbM family methyltransferase